ncbi:hypothetical protein Mp_5g05820 [Marchantia polymorpha subsp. ruderalis]|uniref:Uncharacterized protein n=2 Tax=Marchantia polymorpha TaxID=3197 RepID=A0AAF6BFC9_MARPO|nr:hypothetical protein MARPO_0027s0045 [Marchantia polymorpha]BBN10713.1 hypothetical protein Mp_5g05820 [Marchantia polymorpha subsp. ruderalis]|eukprot:PTQ42921.1 hypothetical protein MARPO_0027s0045 [Marchantia polymorpha]
MHVLAPRIACKGSDSTCRVSESTRRHLKGLRKLRPSTEVVCPAEKSGGAFVRGPSFIGSDISKVLRRRI